MSNFINRIITGIFLSIIIFVILFFTSGPIFLGMLGGITTYILIFEWPRFWHKIPFLLLLSPLYPVLPLILIGLLQIYGYNFLNFFMICLVAAHDTGSYLVGNYCGTYKIALTISPGKTWEGLIGGILATQLVALLFFKGTTPFLSIITLIISLLAFVGDLFESYLKRQVGLKDSGSVLPGHGGFLDRIDSILFVAPFIFYLRKLLTAALIS